jgi:hypothetical protein
MRVITISMELVIDDYCGVSREDIADYLNDKLYTDPEFFGDFGPENIVKVSTLEEDDVTL